MLQLKISSVVVFVCVFFFCKPHDKNALAPSVHCTWPDTGFAKEKHAEPENVLLLVSAIHKIATTSIFHFQCATQLFEFEFVLVDAVISEAFASALGFFYIVSFGINPIFYFSFIRTYRDALIDLLHLRAYVRPHAVCLFVCHEKPTALPPSSPVTSLWFAHTLIVCLYDMRSPRPSPSPPPPPSPVTSFIR